MALSQDIFVDITLQNSLDQSDILFLRHTATVIDLSAKHVQHLIRHVIISLNELEKLHSAHFQVLIREGVWDIPADGTELSPVLDDSVEETEAEQKLFKDFRLRALLKLLRREGLVGLQDVRL